MEQVKKSSFMLFSNQLRVVLKVGLPLIGVLFMHLVDSVELSAEIIKERGKIYWREEDRQVVYYYDDQLRLVDNATQAGSIFAVATKSEKFLALSKTGLLKVYLRSGPLVLSYQADKFSVTALSFLPDDCSVLAGLADGSVLRIYFCGRDKDRQVERYANHWSMVTTLWSHPTQKFFISGDVTGNTVVTKLYDSDYHGGARDIDLMKGHEFVQKGQKRTLSKSYSSEVVKIVGDEFLIVGLREGVLEIFDLRGKRKLRDVKAHNGLLDLIYDPKNDIFITLGEDHKLRLWRIMLVNGGIKVGRDPRLIALAEISLVSHAINGTSRIFGVKTEDSANTAADVFRTDLSDQRPLIECRIRKRSTAELLRSYPILLVNVAVRKAQNIESLQSSNVGAENREIKVLEVLGRNCRLAGQSKIPEDRFYGYTDLDPEEVKPPKKKKKGKASSEKEKDKGSGSVKGEEETEDKAEEDSQEL